MVGGGGATLSTSSRMAATSTSPELTGWLVDQGQGERAAAQEHLDQRTHEEGGEEAGEEEQPGLAFRQAPHQRMTGGHDEEPRIGPQGDLPAGDVPPEGETFRD